MFTLPPSIVDLIIQAISNAAWNRPELTKLREPIQQALVADTFRQLTERAFQTFADRSSTDLPEFLDDGFIRMPAVQEHLGAYIVKGEQANLDTLAELYTRRYLRPASAPDVRTHLAAYLRQVRETFAVDPTYGPILLARDVQSMTAALNNLRSEMHGRFDDVISRLDALLKEPEIKALVERKGGSHIFLSYSRHNLALALQVRNALEDAGHTIWQDTTAIKGGAEWIKSIEDGIERAYAVVSVVSQESQASEWVTIEFLHARRRNKPIVPIRVDSCEIPTMMLAMNVIHGHPDLGAGITAMLATLPHSERTEPDDKPLDRRDQEIAYLDRMLLEHSVWQTVYTPMAGVARIRQRPDKPQIKRAVATITPMFNPLRQDIAETFAEAASVKEESFEDIIEAVKRVKQVVVMGDPGAGKTTTLWKLAADYAEAAKNDPAAPLPVLLKLGALSPNVSVREQIQAQVGELPLDDLLTGKRLALLIDALNELSAERRKEKADQVRDLVEQARQGGMVAVVTCRREDYKGNLDLNIEEQVQIAPLDVHRIRQFCVNHLPEDGEKLFWDLAGGAEALEAWEKWEQAGATWDLFWTAEDVPRKDPDVYNKTNDRLDEVWRKARGPRSMLALARNPYMLFMMTEVFSETGSLPPNRGKLFEVFTHYLLQIREKLAKPEAETLENALAALAYQMQTDGLGTAAEQELARRHLNQEQLYQAVSANLLDGSDPVRFTHQLLQEYFAARRLDQEMRNGVPASQFWPPDKWWQPQDWEETAILLAGLYSDDTTPVVEWLCDAQPELTARCILESGAHTPPKTQAALRPGWLPRLTEVSKLPVERAAVGRALGLLRLDSRDGVELKDGLPDIAWAEIPAGPFQMGGDEEADNAWAGATITLPYNYWIAKYPVTVAHYETFVNSDGYTNQGYWTEAGWAWKKDQSQPEYGWHEPQYHISNHPVIGVTWYEAHAFCQWLTEKLRHTLPTEWEIRLPTEAEWEKAARYPAGREYPWGNEFSASRCNVYESELKHTTPVGMYPDGANPATGIHDLSGNVWEWCLSQWAKEYHYPEENEAEGESARVWRGGSWYFDANVARAAARDANVPNYGGLNRGFRVVCAAPI